MEGHSAGITEAQRPVGLEHSELGEVTGGELRVVLGSKESGDGRADSQTCRAW